MFVPRHTPERVGRHPRGASVRRAGIKEINASVHRGRHRAHDFGRLHPAPADVHSQASMQAAGGPASTGRCRHPQPNVLTCYLRESACADQAQAAVSRAALAKLTQATDRSMDARRAARLAEIDGILSPAGKELLISWTNSNVRPSMTVISVDHARYLAVANMDPATAMARFCTKAAGAPTLGLSPDKRTVTGAD